VQILFLECKTIDTLFYFVLIEVVSTLPTTGGKRRRCSKYKDLDIVKMLYIWLNIKKDEKV
jgi:hypothetical protein